MSSSTIQKFIKCQRTSKLARNIYFYFITTSSNTQKSHSFSLSVICECFWTKCSTCLNCYLGFFSKTNENPMKCWRPITNGKTIHMKNEQSNRKRYTRRHLSWLASIDNSCPIAANAYGILQHDSHRHFSDNTTHNGAFNYEFDFFGMNVVCGWMWFVVFLTILMSNCGVNNCIYLYNNCCAGS